MIISASLLFYAGRSYHLIDFDDQIISTACFAAYARYRGPLGNVRKGALVRFMFNNVTLIVWMHDPAKNILGLLMLFCS
jgi:hypothetical protein